jgi:hypothetical protein
MLIVIGVVLVLISNQMSKKRIRETFGDINQTTVKMSEGTGVVPKSVSWIGLVGYILIVIGFIALFV